MNTVIERMGFDPAQDADNGNRFLTGNGYLGVRGTIGEAGVQQMTAVNLAGIHHQKGQGWEEPLNAPNRPVMLNTSSWYTPAFLQIASVRIIREDAPSTTTQSASAPVSRRMITARNTPA